INPVTDEDGDTLYIYNQWATNTELIRSNAETLYETIIDNSDCYAYVIVTETEDPEIELDQVSRLSLKASIQYTGKLVATGDDDHDVYSFAFKTSAYCSFAHHLNSFIDGVWDNFSLLNDDTYTVDSSLITTALNDTSISEETQYTQLSGLFGLPISRTLPQQMEVTLLNDVSANYGVLLESPEPLEWERITCSASRVTTSDSIIGLSENAVKIMDAAIAVSADANDQWIELMVISSVDLANYEVSYKESNTPEEDEFFSYFTFPEDSSYAEGELIRIYSGIDPESEDLTENHILYAGLTNAPFVDASRTVNLNSAVEELVHSRVLFSESEYGGLTTNLIKNSEGTRAFIFFEDTGVYNDLVDGVYRLKFTYERKKTGLTTFRRYGFDEDEIVQLGFSIPAILPD
ncbi:MAG: hypothetical protein HRT57_12010, partial [Crocinitomicaceae bacterium]|nr:hypothetical protein [Crocinitomicaceae bacterium]